MLKRDYIYYIETKMQQLLVNPKLVYNYDYMEEFMIIKENLEDGSNTIKIAYDHLYTYLVNLYEAYCKYYLSLDNSNYRKVDRKQINALITDYKVEHCPDSKTLQRLIDDVLKALYKECTCL